MNPDAAIAPVQIFRDLLHEDASQIVSRYFDRGHRTFKIYPVCLPGSNQFDGDDNEEIEDRKDYKALSRAGLELKIAVTSLSGSLSSKET